MMIAKSQKLNLETTCNWTSTSLLAYIMMTQDHQIVTTYGPILTMTCPCYYILCSQN